MYLCSCVFLHVWVFLADKWVFFLSNLDLFEITEWEPCIQLLAYLALCFVSIIPVFFMEWPFV